MTKFPLYNYKSISKLAKFLHFTDKKEFLTFLESTKTNSKQNYKIYTLKNKKNRQVFECKPEMKKIHTQLKNCFLAIDAPNYLFSGVKKKSYISNAKFHRSSKNFYIIDIKSFYPNITVGKIYKTFISGFNHSHNVADALSHLLTIESKGKRFLVTGSPLSQIVAYFINKPMFDKLDKLSKKYGITFSLYVDDLTFSSKRQIPEIFKNEVQKIISYYDYQFSMEKIQTSTIHTRTAKYPKITGVSIKQNSHLFLPTEREDILYSKFNHFTSLTQNDIKDFFKDIDTINGLIIEAMQINAEHYGGLQTNLNTFVKDYLSNHKQAVIKYILMEFSFLNYHIKHKDIINFTKKYVATVTKTSRLLNILSDKKTTELIHQEVNNIYQTFIQNNADLLHYMKKQKTTSALITKILSDFSRGCIYI